MTVLDKFIGYFSPERGLARTKARRITALYETATHTRTNKTPLSTGDGDRSVTQAGPAIREQARHLDENHDLAHGVLSTLVNNTVGPNGISIEPAPKDKSGEIIPELALALESLHKDWSLKPETTQEYDRAAMERMMARSLFRDGEYFVQHLSGRIPTLEHGTRVPYTLELLEADMVPFSYGESFMARPNVPNVFNGVQKNAWGRPLAYYVYHQHPGAANTFDSKIKSVPARNMTHGKLTTRIRQTRGVSALAPVLTRLSDLKSYEESERVAARISAAVAFQVKRGSPDMYVPENDLSEDSYDEEARTFPIAPGIVFDNLQVGEEISDVSSTRPSQLLQPFRDSMLRAVASGSGAGYSSISRNYDGSYSSQRQELVEQFVNYSTLTALMVGQYARPAWQRFVNAAVAAGLIQLPANLDKDTLYDAEFRGPVMPWIDPVKEANANLVMVSAGFKSQAQVIRERGGNPRQTMAEIQRERAEAEERGLAFSYDPVSSTTPDPEIEKDNDDGEEEAAK